MTILFYATFVLELLFKALVGILRNDLGDGLGSLLTSRLGN